MTKKEKGTQLEQTVLAYLKTFDHKARLSRGSGNNNDIGDVNNSFFFIECKNWNKENIIMQMKDWNHLVNQMPINTSKTPIYCFQNNQNKRFVILDMDDFFKFAYNLYKSLY